MGETVLAESREAIRVGSKSFSAAARLFDKGCREDAYMLYAWCRYCDDRIDAQHLGHGTTDETEPVQARLQRQALPDPQGKRCHDPHGGDNERQQQSTPLRSRDMF